MLAGSPTCGMQGNTGRQKGTIMGDLTEKQRQAGHERFHRYVARLNRRETGVAWAGGDAARWTPLAVPPDEECDTDHNGTYRDIPGQDTHS